MFRVEDERELVVQREGQELTEHAESKDRRKLSHGVESEHGSHEKRPSEKDAVSLIEKRRRQVLNANG